MPIVCPCQFESDYIEMSNNWIVEESGFSAKELLNDVMDYISFQKFASESKCNGVIIFTNSFDSESQITKYLKKLENEINLDDEFIYNINYGFEKYIMKYFINTKSVVCGVINFKPKTPMKNFTIDDGGLRKRH